MTRSRRGFVNKKRHKKTIKISSGYYGRSKNCFRVAIQKVEKGLSYAYRDRKNKKRFFRSLWIQRINAALKKRGLKYSYMLDKIKKKKIYINRKMISEMIIFNKNNFFEIMKNIYNNDL